MAKCLIIEDNAYCRLTIRTFLEKMGHQVVGEVEDAASALIHIERHKPEIVLLDLILPGKSGIEIIDEIRKISNSIKIVIITALDQLEIDQKLAEKKCTAVIKKPFTSEEFKGAIENVLSQKTTVV